jgi:DNA-binding transcriptional ArsR family regulator
MDPDLVFAAIADASRRALLQRLAYGSATTGQLADLLPMSRPAVSQHLKLLQEAGLVRTEPRGRHRWHRLDPARVDLVRAWAGDLVARHALVHVDAHSQERRSHREVPA